ncbi:phosphate acetyltransferase [[Mycoplasma] mobile]|uniref:Phosphotransacetylase n=1 Tax=Mycoplasma mobile (strain ATCC 43663 / 163K / NCTC 11711) TaxID=267748 RepID=Q6KIC2_MYCM1|nr:phosphate acetyltransferase [[Mycoplasma] mobile]AAT27654.1 phosphotransacetylase [Mycoplasma mobile 163K]
MLFTEKIKTSVKNLAKKYKVLLVDGDDSRAQEAARMLQDSDLVEVSLLVENPTNAKGLKFINMNDNKNLKTEFITKILEFRKGKETEESAKSAVETRPFYAAMLLKENYFDAVVGGLLYKTSDILRAAFKIIGSKKGQKTISSSMIMHKNDEAFLFSDISVQIKPDATQLAEIGLNASEFAKALGLKDTVAFLSFSTAKSAVSPESETVSQATEIYNSKTSGIKAIGEIQLDAAIDLKVREAKFGKSSFESKPDVFVFPDLGAGNIGYKLVQRFGNYGAIGPIVNGISKPMNDLSRGSTSEDVFYTVLISVLQAAHNEKESK